MLDKSMSFLSKLFRKKPSYVHPVFGELVQGEEQIASIIDVDDNAEIGFRQRVTLHRSSDALLIAEDDRERIFYVLSDTVA